MLHARTLVGDARFDPSFRQLADLRDVADLVVDAGTIRLIATLSPFSAGARQALVVGSDVAYGMARMFQMLRDDNGGDLQIFRRLSDALEWLGLAGAEPEITALLHAAPPLTVP